jgi:hypothetical protein
MTLTDMLRYGGVIIQVVATMSCLAADSKTPVTDPSSKVTTTNLHQQTGLVLLESKRVMVSVETAQRTCASPQVLIEHDSPPPWKKGVSFWMRFPKVGGLATVPEEWEAWRVVNMHRDNFFEAVSRLKMSSVKVDLLRIKDFARNPINRGDRFVGYAVVTDARIPRNWYRSPPSFPSHPPQTARELKEAYPEIFGP